MSELAHLLAFVLSAMGLTVLLAWPQDGPGAWVREKVLRKLLPRAVGGVLDCYVCLGFWAGLLLSPAGWWLYREPWCWAGCLMVPAAFWIVMRESG
jgi:hypothetical protein